MSKFKNAWYALFPPPPTTVVEDNKPKASVSFVNGVTVITDYNKAFVNDLKSKLGNLTDDKSDEEIVQLFIERENLEHEEPKLEVLHLGMEEDGSVKMKLDWNQSFIRMLKENNIVGSTDEEAVEIYLMLLQRKVTDEMGMNDFTREATDVAFASIDRDLRDEAEFALEQVLQEKKSNKGRKPRRKRSLDNAASPTDHPGF